MLGKGEGIAEGAMGMGERGVRERGIREGGVIGERGMGWERGTGSGAGVASWDREEGEEEGCWLRRGCLGRGCWQEREGKIRVRGEK